jgi:hypothetical protein
MKGDKNSYLFFTGWYRDKIMDKDYLDLSIMMYEKHHYDYALSNIYRAYIFKYNNAVPFSNDNLAELFKKVPKEEQLIALKYLKVWY